MFTDLPDAYANPPRQKPRRATERRDADRSRWWSPATKNAYSEALLLANGTLEEGNDFALSLVASIAPSISALAVAWGSGSTSGYPIPGEGSFPGGGSGKANKLGLKGVVNSATANLTLAWPIVSFPTAGDLDVSLTFFHNSQSSVSGDLGDGWTHSYNTNIVWNSTHAFVEMPDGLVVPFTKSGPNYDAPAGFYGKLEDTMTGRKLTTRDHKIYHYTTYSSVQLLTSIEDRSGNLITLTRTGGGQLTTVTAPDSRALNFVYASGRLDYVTGPGSKTWDFGYDGSQRLDTTTFPAPSGKTREVVLAYDSNDNVVSELDCNGESWTWSYSTDNATGWADPGTGAAAATFSYSSPDATMNLAGSGSYVHTYDSGYLWLVTDPDLYYNEYNFYDTAVAKPTAVFDKRGEVTIFSYNAMGQVIQKTTPLGFDWFYSYTSFNDVDDVTSPVSGEYIDYIYDGNGRLIQVTQNVTSSTTRDVVKITYDGYGQIDTVEDALKRITDYDYNPRGELDQVLQPDYAAKYYAYDDYSRLTDAYDNAVNTTVNTYDETGWLIQVQNPDLTTTSYEYDDNGNRTDFYDELSRHQTWLYDESGRMIKHTNARGDENEYTYYQPGWIDTHENGNGNFLDYTYTSRGDLLALSHLDGGIEYWVRDEDGRVFRHELDLFLGAGYDEYTYDDDGRLTNINYPTTADVTFTYDDANRREQMVDGTGTTNWDYDLAGQLTDLDTPQGQIDYSYNDDGTRATMTEVGLGTMTYDWDATTGPLNWVQNRFGETTTYGYHPTLGYLETKVLHSGQFEDYRYDSRYRLDRIRVWDSYLTPLRETKYDFNDASEVESLFVDSVQTDYTYDAASQILTEVRPGYSATYTYDDNGNRLSKAISGGITETYNYSNELLQSVTWNGGLNYKNYTYDSAGRTIEIDDNGTSRYFTYDEESRITAITGSYSATYEYNGLDTRTEKIESSVTRTFMRDGVGVTDPVLNDGAAAYTPGISERRSSTTTYLHSGIKNSDFQTDTGMAQVAERTYDAFGNQTASTGSWQGPFGYGGKFRYQEDGSGLKLLGHRYYDSSTGRFLSRDTAKDGTNWYSYCSNSPLIRADPTGQVAPLIIVAIVVVIALWPQPGHTPTDDDDLGDPSAGDDAKNAVIALGSVIAGVGPAKRLLDGIAATLEGDVSSGSTSGPPPPHISAPNTAPRPSSSSMRRNWENHYGKKWPLDP